MHRYKNLYGAVPRENLNDKLFFESANLLKLNEVELEELERPLTKEECFENSAPKKNENHKTYFITLSKEVETRAVMTGMFLLHDLDQIGI